MKSFKEFIKNYKNNILSTQHISKLPVSATTLSDNKYETPEGYESVHLGFLKKKNKKLNEELSSFNSTSLPDAKINKLHTKLNKHYKNSKSHFVHSSAIEHYTGNGYVELNKNLYTKRRHDSLWRQSFDDALSDCARSYKTPENMHVYTGIKKPIENLTANKTVPTTGSKLRLHMPAYTSTSIDPYIAKGFSRWNKNPDYKKIKHLAGKHIFTHDLSVVPDHIVNLYDKWNAKYHWNDHKERTALISAVQKHTGKKFHYNPELQNHTGIVKVSDVKTKQTKHVIKIHVPKGSHGIYTGNQNENEKEFVLHKGARVHVSKTPTIHIDHNGQVIHMWHGHLVHDGVKSLK